MNDDKLKPSQSKIFGIHSGGVSWVTDGRWLARAEHVELDDIALSAALRGQPWTYRIDDDGAFSPLTQPLGEAIQKKIVAKLNEPPELAPFIHTGLSLGMEDDLRTNLFLASDDECRWVNAAFIRDQWEDCRFMSVLGGTEDSGSGACAIRVYNGGSDMLQAVIMPMLTPAACKVTLSRMAGVLGCGWGEEEREAQESAERGE